MIDIHAHILPGLDDGPGSLAEALKMARLAAADGIRTMVASPHLFRDRVVDSHAVNGKQAVLESIRLFRGELLREGLELEILPGCDFPLSMEALRLLEEGQVLTINDQNRYLLVELPDTALPPALEEICFHLQDQGITPIITHPERHFILQEMPHKLRRLIDLGCLVQMTGTSLTGGFGRRIKKLSRQLVKQGYVHVLATDAHNSRSRPPLLGAALKELTRLVGASQAQAMVRDLPEKIIQGKPCY